MGVSIICDIKYGLVLLLVLEVPVNIEEGRFFVRCALGKKESFGCRLIRRVPN